MTKKTKFKLDTVNVLAGLISLVIVYIEETHKSSFLFGIHLSKTQHLQIRDYIFNWDSERPWDSHHFLIREELLSHPPFKIAEDKKNIEKDEQKECGKTLSIAFLQEATRALTTKLMLWTQPHESFLFASGFVVVAIVLPADVLIHS